MNYPNVKLSKFVPQKKLLQDDRIKAMITHGGSASMMEAIYYLTPMIACPVKVDQHGNAIRI